MRMATILRTDIFINWVNRLRDRRAAARIATRVLRLADGNAGDVRPVGKA
jgi:putative addiction module killer protein